MRCHFFCLLIFFLFAHSILLFALFFCSPADGAFVHPDSSARYTDVVLFRRATPTAGHSVGGGGVAAGAAGVGHWTIGPAGDIAEQRGKRGWLRTDAAHARRGVVGLLGTQWEFLSSAAFGTYTRDAHIDVNVFGEAGAGQVGAALAAAAAATKAHALLATAGGDESDARARVIFIEMGKSHSQAGRVYKLQCASMDDKTEWLVAFAQARRAQQLLADADAAMRVTPEPAVVGALKLVDDVRSLSRLVARQHRVVHLWSEIGASALSIAAPVSLLKAAYADALESTVQWLRNASPGGAGGGRSERWSSADRSDPMDGSVRARALTAAFDQMRNGSITPREYGKIVQGTAEFDRLVLAGQSSAAEGGSGSFSLGGGAGGGDAPRIAASSHVRMSALSFASIECLDVSDPFGGAEKSAETGGGGCGSGRGSHVRRARVTDVWRQERFARTHNAPLKAIVTSVSGALVASANELGEVLLWTRRAKERKMRATALGGGAERAITAMAILGEIISFSLLFVPFFCYSLYLSLLFQATSCC